MRRAVVDLEGRGTPADIDPQSLPREGRLENALAQVPREEQRVGAGGCDTRQEPQLRHAEILRLVEDDVGKGVMVPLPVVGRDGSEQARRGQVAALLEPAPHSLEDRPYGGPLLAAEMGPPSDAGHLGIGLDVLDLPGIDDMAPLGQQKLLGHACHVLGFGRLHDHAADQVTAGDMRLAPESERVQLLGDAAERGDGDPLQQTRVVRGQHLQLAAERICQGLGEGGEQHVCLAIFTQHAHHSVERHDGLAGAGGARDTGGARSIRDIRGNELYK
jgi:hypothetical protein